MTKQAKGSFRFQKPAQTKESSHLHLHLRIYEGDKDAPVPHGLYGEVMLTDDGGQSVVSFALAPDDLKSVSSFADKLKQKLLKELGAEFVESVETEE